MAHFNPGNSASMLGDCSSACPCSSCRTSSGLSEYYYEGEGRDPPRRPNTSLNGFGGAMPRMRPFFMPPAFAGARFAEAPQTIPPSGGVPTCAFAFRDATRIEIAAARDTLRLSASVAGNFLRTVGALSARGRFIPTIIDNRYWFAKLYEFITFEEIRAAGQFRQPAFVMHFIPHFYAMYYDALTKWLQNNRAPVHPLWSVHFQRSARPDVSSMNAWAAGLRTSIVTGVTAHVQADMATALERAYRSYVAKYCLAPAPRFEDFRSDFFESNRLVFERAKASLLLEASRFGPLPVGPELEQFLFATGEPFAGGLDINEVYRWREQAWAEAKRRLGQ